MLTHFSHFFVRQSASASETLKFHIAVKYLMTSYPMYVSILVTFFKPQCYYVGRSEHITLFLSEHSFSFFQSQYNITWRHKCAAPMRISVLLQCCLMRSSSRARAFSWLHSVLLHSLGDYVRSKLLDSFVRHGFLWVYFSFLNLSGRCLSQLRGYGECTCTWV